MINIKKFTSSLVGGVVLAMLFLSNAAITTATPAPPTPPDTTECTECQTEYDNLVAEYEKLNLIIANVAAYDIEGLLDETTTAIYGSDPLLMTDVLTNSVTDGYLLSGSSCEDSTNSFAYYSSFIYEEIVYCVENEDMWIGTSPEFFNFFEHMMYLSESDPTLPGEWQYILDEMIEDLRDNDGGGEENIEDQLALIDSFFDIFTDCEDLNCPAEVVCPDCEAIAANLDLALDDLIDFEIEAELLDAELTDLEKDIDDVYEKMDELATLKSEFEQMVEDAGGKHGEDCDDFEVQSGQSWGIAHNFGDTQWCFTNEGQLEDMITNLEEYWETHSSKHLPSEAELNTQLDTLLTDYTDALAEYFLLLDDIAAVNNTIDILILQLDDCLTELAALQLQGFCLDQDLEAMEDLLDEATGEVDAGFQPAEPAAEDPAAEDPPIEDPVTEEPATEFTDTAGHWAETFINELFNANIVSGDEETGDFRPNDSINRAEAAKIVSLANEDTVDTCEESYFSDVFSTNWFCIYTTNSKDEGYFEGYSDGTFGPANPILRAEAAAVVLRALGFEVPEYTKYSFPDIDGSEWYADYAEKAYACGIIEGRNVNGEKLFEGESNITRAEFAKIVNVTIFSELLESECS